MLEYERIDVSEGIDFNNSNKSKQRDICHYWYILEKNLGISHIFAMVVMI